MSLERRRFFHDRSADLSFLAHTSVISNRENCQNIEGWITKGCELLLTSLMRCARPFVCAFHKPHPKSKFTATEDELLGQIIEELGTDDWQLIAKQLPGRNARQCRDRWLNYLSPDVGNGPWTREEELLLVEKYREFGSAWKYIASFFKSRTDINVKNRWQLMQRRLRKNSVK
jgi:hypothetical protein